MTMAVLHLLDAEPATRYDGLVTSALTPFLVHHRHHPPHK